MCVFVCACMYAHAHVCRYACMHGWMDGWMNAAPKIRPVPSLTGGRLAALLPRICYAAFPEVDWGVLPTSGPLPRTFLRNRFLGSVGHGRKLASQRGDLENSFGLLLPCCSYCSSRNFDKPGLKPPCPSGPGPERVMKGLLLRGVR